MEFSRAIELLRSYSLVEGIEDVEGYATHPVVHRWAYHYQDQDCRRTIGCLAVLVVGWAVSDSSSGEYWTLQRRLLPHVQACSRWILEDDLWGAIDNDGNDELDSSRKKDREVLLGAIDLLGIFYQEQGRLNDAENMFMRALQGNEEVLGPDHTSTLGTVNNLGLLYKSQGKLKEAEKRYKPRSVPNIINGILFLESTIYLGCRYFSKPV